MPRIRSDAAAEPRRHQCGVRDADRPHGAGRDARRTQPDPPGHRDGHGRLRRASSAWRSPRSGGNDLDVTATDAAGNVGRTQLTVTRGKGVAHAQLTLSVANLPAAATSDHVRRDAPGDRRERSRGGRGDRDVQPLSAGRADVHVPGHHAGRPRNWTGVTPVGRDPGGRRACDSHGDASGRFHPHQDRGLHRSLTAPAGPGREASAVADVRIRLAASASRRARASPREPRRSAGATVGASTRRPTARTSGPRCRWLAPGGCAQHGQRTFGDPRLGGDPARRAGAWSEPAAADTADPASAS